MTENYRRAISQVVGNGSAGTISFRFPTDQRIHSANWTFSHAGGTNSIAAAMALISEIRVKVGTTVRKKFATVGATTGGQMLRDYLLLNGTGYDFTGLPNVVAGSNRGIKMYLPFAEPWFLASIADALALNPQRLGGEVSLEIDTSVAATVTPELEVSNDINALSAGIITNEVISPVAGGLAVLISQELEARGRLIALQIYPDTLGSNAINRVTVMRGSDEIMLHGPRYADENFADLLRHGMNSAATGRSVATIHDVVPVNDDALAHGWRMDLGKIKVRCEAAGAMNGNLPVLVTRIEDK